MRDQWMLDPAITYLNHGTVGAPPRRVLAVQQELRDEIERQPSHFLLRKLTASRLGATQACAPKLREAADAVAAFVGAEGKDLVFIDNCTTGVNAVLRSFDFSEGDELLIPDLAYGAIRNAAEYATRVRGAHLRVVELPEDIAHPDAVVEAIESSITPRTRLALVDHITSESALVMPLKEIAARCHKHGVAVLVDGAHVPGAIALDIPATGVDWYAANLHKWAWSPRSSGILWVNPTRQATLHHTVISWGLDLGMTHEFDWPGTRDPTPHLAAPAGIEYMRELGVDAVQRYNHELAWAAGCAMADGWKSRLLGPRSMIGAMVTVPLPESFGSTREEASALRDKLLFDHAIEVHVHAWKGRLRVRVSAQIYNEMQDIEQLLTAIDELGN